MAPKEEGSRSSDLPPLEIFCSYAHKDEPLRRQLEQHLSLLSRQGIATLWHDRRITPGMDWTQTIDTRLETASVILLLISSNFLFSDYCYGIEMQQALQRHEANKAVVIPILLRSCDWQSAPFAALQVLPTGTKPITAWRDRDAAWTDVVAGLRRVLTKLWPSVAVPRSSSPAIWTIPFARNPFFTGRQALLERLHTQIQTTQMVALSQAQAISGLGGVGKTQLAIEYAYRYGQEYQTVLWAQAETIEALTTSYNEIAKLLKLPQHDAQGQEAIVQAVKEWLRTNPGWLLLLDNADELSILQPFLPTRFAGHLLLTTRVQITGKFARRLEVDTLDTQVGALLILRRSGLIDADASWDAASPLDQSLALVLTKELGGLPLALDQAGAYIEETQCSLANYVQQYQTRRSELLAHRGMVGDDHPEPVATTWSLSFAKVEQANPMAAELLRICAFLAPDAIPEELLVEALKTPRLISGEIFTAGQLDEIVALLRAYSLVQRNSQKKTISVHRLVQAVIQDDMEQETQRMWAERVIRAVYGTFPDKVNDAKTWPQCQRCLPHVQVCAELIQKYGLVFFEAVQLLNRAGYYIVGYDMREQTHGPEMEEPFLQEQEMSEKPDPEYLFSYAEKFFLQAITISEQLGSEYLLSTVQLLNGCARLYFDHYKYARAASLYKRVLALREQILDPEHREICMNLNSLALTYWYMGNQGEKQKYAEAESLYLRALPISEQKFGPEDNQTLLILNNLALLYRSQRKYEDAIELHKHVMEIRERKGPPVPLELAQSLQNLAVTYYEQDDQSRYTEAASLLTQALAIRERLLPAMHPQMARCMNYLACVYLSQSKYEEAAQYFKRALDIFEAVFGADNPQTIETKRNYIKAIKRDNTSE